MTIVEMITCHTDYFGWDSTLRNGWGGLIPKQCLLLYDDHCKLHCPKNEDTLEEVEPHTDLDEMVIIYSITCHYCDRTWGFKEKPIEIID